VVRVEEETRTFVDLFGHVGAGVRGVGTVMLGVVVDLEDTVLDAAALVGEGVVGCDGDFAFCDEVVEGGYGFLVFALTRRSFK
jgi:hypothetical protein